MGWMRAMFLGDLGNWMDSSDNAHRIKTLTARARRKSLVDRTQNQRLDQLEGENDELKVCVSALAQLLVSKGVLSRDDVAGFIDPMEAQSGGSA